MAKDGTSRGGARPGAGRKKKALSEKIAAGNPGHRPLKMLDPVAIDTNGELTGAPVFAFLPIKPSFVIASSH